MATVARGLRPGTLMSVARQDTNGAQSWREVPKTTGRLMRVLRLVQILRTGHSGTVDDLAKLLSVSRRTVFRDLELLARAGYRFTYQRKTRRYSTEQTMIP